MLKNTIDVLIVGAGPVGLTLAAELARHDVPFRIIDKNNSISQESRAVGVQARTLEMLADMGIISEFFSRGHRLNGMRMFSDGKPLLSMNTNYIDSPYNCVLALPQSETESILVGHLANLEKEVERGVELVSLEQETEHVNVVIAYDDHQEALQAKYIVGCDGAHSQVRKSIGLEFAGTQFPEQWLNGDVYADFSSDPNYVHVYYHGNSVLAIIPINAKRLRIISNYRQHHPEENQQGQPTVAELQTLIERYIPDSTIQLGDAVWLNEFGIHFRNAQSMRKQRVFLAGDAAHIHSPVGGQGMNTGMQDVYNLAWKLSLVFKGKAKQALLDSYEAERLPVAKEVISNTNRFTKLITLTNPVLRYLRNCLLPLLFRNKKIHHAIVNNLAELNINYRKSILVDEDWLIGKKHPSTLRLPAGDRAPDAPLTLMPSQQASSIHRALQGPQFNLLLFQGKQDLSENIEKFMALAEQIKQQAGEFINIHFILHQDSQQLQAYGKIYLDKNNQAHKRYFSKKSSVYLIRPDGYISYRACPISIDSLLIYWDKLMLGTVV